MLGDLNSGDPTGEGVGEFVDRDRGDDTGAEEPAGVHEEEGVEFVIGKPGVADADAFDVDSAGGEGEEAKDGPKRSWILRMGRS